MNTPEKTAAKKKPFKSNMSEYWLAQIKEYSGVLGIMLEAFKTPEICLAAVQKDGLELRHVPKAWITPELCLAAVQRDASALEFVPEALITADFCLAAVQGYRMCRKAGAGRR